MTDTTDTVAPAPDTVAEAPQTVGREIEIKLTGDTRQIVDACDWLARNGAAFRPRAANLHSVYFDTADERLRAAGMALRVRKVRGRHVLTFKWRSDDAATAFERGEAEARLAGPEPDIDALGADTAALIRGVCGEAPLEQRFTTELKRRDAVALPGLSSIKVAVDRGHVFAGDRSVEVEEIEFELADGDIGDLIDLAARLTDACGLRLGSRTKSERGYALAAGELPQCVKALPLTLADDAATEVAMGSILIAAVEQFVANWPGLLEAELPESVHQMRVALRRLRAAIKLFQREFPCADFAILERRAADIASAMGQARDMDAFTALVQDGPGNTLKDDADFGPLLESAAVRRFEGYEKVRAVLLDPMTTGFVLELYSFVLRRGWRGALDVEALGRLSMPAQTFANETLDRLHKRVRKRGKDLERLTVDERHRLRIAFKDLRYAAEFFTALYPHKAGAKSFIRSISKLQDVFGAYNDTITAHTIVAALEGEGTIDAAAGMVLGWCARGAADAETHLAASWKTFRKLEKFWH